MEVLAVFDAGDYQDTVSVYEKYSVRGIICREGKLAMQCSREGEYKIPGGGLEKGEDFTRALVREILEETGLHVIEESILELGEIREIRKDLFNPRKKYICHSMFFYCETGERQEELQLTTSERAKGYEMKWATPQAIYERNASIGKDPWIIRDTAFIKMLVDGKVKLPLGENKK